MNRRGFISLLAGSAGTVLVPWRGTIEPSIFLPPRGVDLRRYLTPNNTWFLRDAVDSPGKRIRLGPPYVWVSRMPYKV